MKRNRTIKILLTFFFVLAATQSHAILTFGPGDADYFGFDNSNSGMLLEFYGLSGFDLTNELDFDLLYKAEVPTGEEGYFSMSYTTTFSDTPTDPSGATISFDGGDAITGMGSWLLVKDGNHEPAWYAFDLDLWDGEESIVLQNFWPNQGAISHVAIYGAPIPEPATMLLFGSGLIGLAGAGMRRKKK